MGGQDGTEFAASLLVVSVYSQNSTQNEYKEWKPSQNEYTDFDVGKYTTPDIVKWAKITKTSTDTALRDIKDLIEKGILQQEEGGGRNANYTLKC